MPPAPSRSPPGSGSRIPDYFELQFRMYEDVKKIFDQNGISIPFNQLDVHITQN